MKKIKVTLYILTTLLFLGCNFIEKKETIVFEPTVESLQQYECPEWFKDAKFGIWVCWNAYAVAGESNWYARNMYIEGHPTYNYHVENFGHPSEFGFKDIVDLWKGENFKPEELMKLFKNTGAKYFVAMANHHENFDLWDSKHQPWNSVNYGPKIDIIGKWREVALKNGLRWGITSHAERTWSWLQVAKGADKKGPYKGVPYDGANPEFEQMYLPPDANGDTSHTQPKNAPIYWRDYWFNRCKDLIDNYRPDLFYVDGGVPFPGEDQGRTGLKMISHLYNQNASWHNGTNEAVMCIKNWLDIAPDRSWGHYWDGIGTRDYERDRSDEIRKEPWQTDTSIGHWFWNRNEKYRSSKNVIHELVDIVSKNGNLLLNVPLRADGTLDKDAETILQDIAQWMNVNSESIYATRYWKIPGADKLRVVQKNGDLYITSFEWPQDGVITIPFLLTKQEDVQLRGISLLGSQDKLSYVETKKGVKITLPKEKPCESAWVFKVEGENFNKIDVSNVDFQNDETRAASAINSWITASIKRPIKAEATEIESNGNGHNWMITKEGQLAFMAGNNKKVTNIKAIDVSCSFKDLVVIVTPEGELKKKVANGWELIPSPKKALRVSVSPEGHIAVVNQDHSMSRYNGTWHNLKGEATDIAYGIDGFLAHIGSGNSLYVSNDGESWKSAGGKLKSISVTPKTNKVVGVNWDGEIWIWKETWQKFPENAMAVGTGQTDDDEVVVFVN